MEKGEKPVGSVGYHEVYVHEHLCTPRRAQGMAGSQKLSISQVQMEDINLHIYNSTKLGSLVGTDLQSGD